MAPRHTRTPSFKDPTDPSEGTKETHKRHESEPVQVEIFQDAPSLPSEVDDSDHMEIDPILKPTALIPSSKTSVKRRSVTVRQKDNTSGKPNKIVRASPKVVGVHPNITSQVSDHQQEKLPLEAGMPDMERQSTENEQAGGHQTFTKEQSKSGDFTSQGHNQDVDTVIQDPEQQDSAMHTDEHDIEEPRLSREQKSKGRTVPLHAQADEVVLEEPINAPNGPDPSNMTIEEVLTRAGSIVGPPEYIYNDQEMIGIVPGDKIRSPESPKQYLTRAEVNAMRRLPIIPALPSVTRTTVQLFFTFLYLFTQRKWQKGIRLIPKMEFFAKVEPLLSYPNKVRHMIHSEHYMSLFETAMVEVASELWKTRYHDDWIEPTRVRGYNEHHPNFQDSPIRYIGWHVRENREILAFNKLIMNKTHEEDARVTDLLLAAGKPDVPTSFLLRQLLVLTKLRKHHEKLIVRIRRLQIAVDDEVKQMEKDAGMSSGIEDMNEHEFMEYHTYAVPHGVPPIDITTLGSQHSGEKIEEAETTESVQIEAAESNGSINVTIENEETHSATEEADTTMRPPPLPKTPKRVSRTSALPTPPETATFHYPPPAHMYTIAEREPTPTTDDEEFEALLESTFFSGKKLKIRLVTKPGSTVRKGVAVHTNKRSRKTRRADGDDENDSDFVVDEVPVQPVKKKKTIPKSKRGRLQRGRKRA